MWAVLAHSTLDLCYTVFDIDDKEDRSIGVFSENFIDLNVVGAE